jgi:pimeloyl-ACP methyl ester carboxylesterase
VPSVSAPDGATISYETTGAGPVVVLVHGITESRHSWDPLIGELALDFQVVAVDLRGHGASERRAPFDALTMAGDVHAVVEAVGAPSPLMIGHSLGGAVVTIYASAYAPRGVINVDQALSLTGFKAVLTEIEPMLRGDDASFRAAVDGMFEGLYGPLSSEERARIAEYASPEQEVVVGVWDMILKSDVAALDELIDTTAGGIDMPYLALHGSDPGAEYREWLAKTLPTSTFELWDGDGHFPHLVEPQRFLERVHDFEHEL